MTFFSYLRHLRHGPLRSLSPFWIACGRLFRFIIAKFSLNFTEPHFIGSYGPFNMEGKFAFSDFASWGDKHNRGFAACIEACRGANCVFDVGAHIGLVTMPMSKAVAPGGKIYAFEPSIANLQTLKNHIALNNIENVTTIHSLVGNSVRDRVTFYESPSISGMNTCAPIKNIRQYNQTTQQQTSLDEFCLKYRLLPHIIKIDVEGFELAVLEGAKELLTRIKPKIFLSVHPQHLASLGRSPEELKAFLSGVNYTISDMDGKKIDRFTLNEYLLTPQNR